MSGFISTVSGFVVIRRLGGSVVQGLWTLPLMVRFRHEILVLLGVTRFVNYG
jgi:hypothetical protein